MEKITKKELSCSCGCGEHNHHSSWWRLIRVLLGCFIILLALLVGMAVGRRQALMGDGWGYSTLGAGKNMTMVMRQSGALSPNAMFLSTGGSAMAQPVLNPVAAAPKIDPNAQRVAGVITGISGTAITILDNGGNSQIVYSTSTTDIYSGTTEIPLSSLKPKQFVVSYVVSKNNQQVAERIEVSQ